MKLSKEKMIQACDLMLEGKSMARIAKIIGIAESTLWRWWSESQEPEHMLRYTFPWGAWGEATFYQHLESAASGSIKSLGSEAVSRGRGMSETQFSDRFFQGRPVYKVRDDIIIAGMENATPDELELCFGTRCIYEIDEATGKIVREQERTAPSDAMVLAVLRAKDKAGNWNEQKSLNMDVQHGGVLVIEESEPKKQLPPPVQQVIEHVGAEEVVEEEPAPPPMPPEMAADPDADLEERIGMRPAEEAPQAAPAPPSEADAKAIDDARKARIRAQYAAIEAAGVKNPRPQGPAKIGHPSPGVD
jgi:hypothetical protein